MLSEQDNQVHEKVEVKHPQIDKIQVLTFMSRPMPSKAFPSHSAALTTPHLALYRLISLARELRVIA